MCGGMGCEVCSFACWGKECYFVSYAKYILTEADSKLPANNPVWEYPENKPE